MVIDSGVGYGWENGVIALPLWECKIHNVHFTTWLCRLYANFNYMEPEDQKPDSRSTFRHNAVGYVFKVPGTDRAPCVPADHTLQTKWG